MRELKKEELDFVRESMVKILRHMTKNVVEKV